MNTVICGDAVKWAQEYDGAPFHALLCDSPYHLTSIVKRFGKDNSAPAQFGKDGVYSRSSRGFMGKQWDGGDVAFHPETWAAFGNVLHPGAFGMAFASSRGWHRLAVAIEDAGFIIHPSIFGWAYGSGFPKATRVNHGAEGFDGHRYGLQALKPALEPIIVFQKPYQGRPTDNITQTGAGVLNIEGGRIGTDEIPSNQWTDNAHPFGGGAGNEYETVTNKGRWPANFILLDDGAAEALDRQTGELTSGAKDGTYKGWGAGREIYGDSKEYHHHCEADSGGASRFFFRVSEQIDSADPVYYEAKASTEERDAGLREFDALASPQEYGLMDDGVHSAHKNEPKRNPHPTVKPLALTRYLATLLLPPAAYAPRRLFVPFAGVASEMIGAFQAGWEDVTGIELTPEYIPIAESRLKYWQGLGWQRELFEVQP
jgi:hypothetical protein